MAYEDDDAQPKPPRGARKGQGKMKDEELQSIVSDLIHDAAKYTDEELSPARAELADLYDVKPLGNEEEGRSRAQLTEVRDGILSTIPSVLRVVFGAERVVEFTPEGAEDVAAAEQKSDYVQHVVVKDNPGFMVLHDALHDGLLKKIGVVKWGWDDSEAKVNHYLEGVTQEQLEMLAAEADVDITAITPEQPPAPDAPPTFSVELTRVEKDGRAWIKALPPEEFIYDREARTIAEALFCGHRTHKTRGDLIAMGVDEKLIDEHGGKDSQLDDNDEELQRREQVSTGWTQSPEAGEANDKILYVEGYALLDVDGDGIAELRKICTIGPGHYPVENKPCRRRPFAAWCPYPAPHTITGQSHGDLLKDLQKVGSAVLRGMLDSLGQAIFPRTWYIEGQTSVEDILSTVIGQPIRMRAPGMAGEFAHNFVGREALSVLAFLQDVNERRTGTNKGATGLDADALQSSTKDAVTAAVTASQERREMITRMFCEQLLKPLFEGVGELLHEHQPRARMVRLRNEWVEIDPATWNAGMDATVNVALGSTLIDEKIRVLAGVAEKQENVLQTMGPGNPLVTLHQYSKTLRKAVELAGWADSSQFFNLVDPNWQPPQQGQEQQSPEMIIAQIEQMKAQADMQIAQMKAQVEMQVKQQELMLKQQELMLKEREVALKDDRERDKQAAEIQLKIKELEMKHQIDIKEAEVSAEIERERIASQSANTGSSGS